MGVGDEGGGSQGGGGDGTRNELRHTSREVLKAKHISTL